MRQIWFLGSWTSRAWLPITLLSPGCHQRSLTTRGRHWAWRALGSTPWVLLTRLMDMLSECLIKISEQLKMNGMQIGLISYGSRWIRVRSLRRNCHSGIMSDERRRDGACSVARDRIGTQKINRLACIDVVVIVAFLWWASNEIRPAPKTCLYSKLN